MKRKFRVCKVGQTTDGREITLPQVTEMAESYSPSTYGARVNIEHFRSVYPSTSGFGSYGDVTALEVEKDGNDVYLLAEIDPTPELISLAKARQKVYFSVEIDPKFAGTGKAYLVGLACTDSPASLGTSYMQFCQQNPETSPLKAKKQTAHNLFSSSEMVADWPDEQRGIFETIKGYFNKTESQLDKVEKSAQALDNLPESLNGLEKGQQLIALSLDEQARQLKTLAQRLDTLEKGQTSQAEMLNKFEKTLDSTPPQHFRQRPKANGGDGDDHTTDC